MWICYRTVNISEFSFRPDHSVYTLLRQCVNMIHYEILIDAANLNLWVSQTIYFLTNQHKKENSTRFYDSVFNSENYNRYVFLISIATSFRIINYYVIDFVITSYIVTIYKSQMIRVTRLYNFYAWTGLLITVHPCEMIINCLCNKLWQFNH